MADSGPWRDAIEKPDNALRGAAEAADVSRSAAEFERCAARFRACPAIGLRTRILLGFAGGMCLLFVAGLFAHPLLAAGVVITAATASIFYFLVSGFCDNTYLFQKARESALGAIFRNWLVELTAALFFFLALWLFGFLCIAVAIWLVAAGAALMLYGYVDRRIAAWRAGPVRDTKELLQGLRKNGSQETEIQEMAARRGGEHWEEFFEALFGYAALLEARGRWGRREDGRRRPQFRPWRDPIIRWIDARLAARQTAEQTKPLDEGLREKLYTLQAGPAGDKSAMQYRALLATTSDADQQAPPSAWARARDAATAFFAAIVGAKMRLLAGSVLLLGCLLWAGQNGILRNLSRQQWDDSVGKLDELRTDAQAGDADALLAKSDDLAVERSGRYKPLELRGVPAGATAVFDNFNPGVAGAILVLSALVSGVRISLFVLPAAAAMLFAHRTGIPGLVPPLGNSVTSLVIGLTVSIAGFLFGRESK